MPDIQTFESKVDWADYLTLNRYEGTKKAWVYIFDDNLSLGEVGNAFFHGLQQLVDEWVCFDKIGIFRSLDECPHSMEGYWCLWFEDAYFVKPYKNKSNLGLSSKNLLILEHEEN